MPTRTQIAAARALVAIKRSAKEPVDNQLARTAAMPLQVDMGVAAEERAIESAIDRAVDAVVRGADAQEALDAQLGSWGSGSNTLSLMARFATALLQQYERTGDPRTLKAGRETLAVAAAQADLALQARGTVVEPTLPPRPSA